MSKPRRNLTRRYKYAGNFLTAAQAFFTVAAVIAVIFFCFEYKHESPPEKIQKAVMSRIDFNRNSEFFQQLEIRDPGRVFGVPDGGFKTVKPEFNHRKIFSIRPEFAGKTEIISKNFLPIAENKFPPSPGNCDLFPPENKLPEIKTSVIITPEGESLPLKLDNNRNVTGKTIVNIYRKGTLKRFRIVTSCGNIKADNSAGNAILKLNTANGTHSGTYTVIWAENNRENKK